MYYLRNPSSIRNQRCSGCLAPGDLKNCGALHCRILLIIKLSVTYQQHTFQIKFKQKGGKEIIWDWISELWREINNNQTSVFWIVRALSDKQLLPSHCIKLLGENTVAGKQSVCKERRGEKFVNEPGSDWNLPCGYIAFIPLSISVSSINMLGFILYSVNYTKASNGLYHNVIICIHSSSAKFAKYFNILMLEIYCTLRHLVSGMFSWLVLISLCCCCAYFLKIFYPDWSPS